MNIVKRIFAGLAMILFGIGLGILLLELGLRIVPEAKWKGLISKSPDRYILYKTDQRVGWVHVPGAHLNWAGTGEYEVAVQINSLGLRDFERAYDKPPGTFRILVLGDSFTEGLQVNLEQTFSARLSKCLSERLSRQVEVINAGVSGYGPGDELLFYSQIGLKYEPDLVLVAVYTGNDVQDMARDVDSNMIQSFGGYQFYLQAGRLKWQWLEWTKPDDTIPRPERFLRSYSKLYYIFKAPDSTVRGWLEDKIDDWRPDLTDSPPVTEQKTAWPAYAYDRGLIIFVKNFPDNPVVSPPMRDLWELFKAPLSELQSQVQAHQAHLAAVIIPSGAQIHEEMYKSYMSRYLKKYKDLPLLDWDKSAPNKAIGDFLRQRHIPTLDLMPGFQSKGDLLYYPKDGHFNEKGHEVTAALLCDWLMKNEAVPLAASPGLSPSGTQ